MLKGYGSFKPSELGMVIQKREREGGNTAGLLPETPPSYPTKAHNLVPRTTDYCLQSCLPSPSLRTRTLQNEANTLRGPRDATGAGKR